MSQVSKPFTQPLLKETPATTGFISHLAANLFFILLLSASLIFTYWSFQVLNQVDTSALQDVGITSLEKTINADGETQYFVAYTVALPNNGQGQTISYQRKRIPSALFFELQNNGSTAVSIVSENPQQTQILPQKSSASSLASYSCTARDDPDWDFCQHDFTFICSCAPFSLLMKVSP